MDPLLIVTLGTLLGCLISLSWFAGSDAPFVVTNTELISKVLKAAGLKKGKRFYELGSGDGRIVVAAAKLGAISYGIEQSWIRVWYSRYQAKKLKLKECFFFHGDIFQRNYYSADTVYIFLLPKGVEKLEKKLVGELKKGSVVITQTFHFKSWKPYKKIKAPKDSQILSATGKQAGEFWLYRK